MMTTGGARDAVCFLYICFYITSILIYLQVTIHVRRRWMLVPPYPPLRLDITTTTPQETPVSLLPPPHITIIIFYLQYLKI
jgi:hypothetical protein